MKKTLFLLLITISGFSQTLPNPTYSTVTIKNSATVTSTPALTTTEATGLQKKIDPVNLPVSTATQTALNAKSNDVDVLHKTGNETKTGTLTLANNLNLAAISANSTNGFVLKNNQPFIHNFYAGTNPLTGGTGNNTFFGVNSGNFNSNNFTYASTMIGFESGMSNKNGYSNTGIGYYALRLNENGFGNTALGTFVLGNSINGDQNTSVGWHSMLYRTGGTSNTGMGVDVLKENLLGNFNTAYGTNAGANNVSGDLNLFLGYAAGFNELGSGKLYISNSSTADPLIKGNFSTNSLALGGGVGNKVDIYGVGSIVKTDYRTHANVLTPVIYDASNYTFNLNASGAFAINSTGAAVGLTSGNINKFEVLTASSTGGSGVNGMAVHDGQAQRMALLSGVNTASSYSWIQAIKGGVGFRPIFLNPNGGGVSIGNTTDAGTGNLNIAGKATAGSPATVANDLMRKGEVDTAIATADAGNMKLTGHQSFTGTKSGTTSTLDRLLDLTNNSTHGASDAMRVSVNGSGVGFKTFTNNANSTGQWIEQSGGVGLFILANSASSNSISTDGSSSFANVSVRHRSSGGGIKVFGTAPSTGAGIIADTQGTGLNYVGRNNGADTFTVDKTGQIKSNALVGTGLRLLVADASGNITPATTLPVFADNTAAIAGGLGVGRPYRTVNGLLAIVF